MHCDNGPDVYYGVQMEQDVCGSSASLNVWGSSPAQRSFGLLCLLCRFGDFTACRGFLFHTFYHSHRHRLTHVSDSKTAWGIKKISDINFIYSQKGKKLRFLINFFLQASIFTIRGAIPCKSIHASWMFSYFAFILLLINVNLYIY